MTAGIFICGLGDGTLKLQWLEVLNEGEHTRQCKRGTFNLRILIFTFYHARYKYSCQTYNIGKTSASWMCHTAVPKDYFSTTNIVDRTRTLVVNGMRKKLKEKMDEYQEPREKINAK